jgi:hypothetical protein
MTAITYTIKGPAGKKYACAVPQNVHEINGTKYNMDTLTIAEAEVIMLVNPTFLIKNTAAADAEKKEKSNKPR